MEYKLKKNCIYCLQPIDRRKKYHILQQSIGGKLVYPLACARHNFNLGGDLEANTIKDYWVNFAIRRLGLKDLKIDASFTPDSRQNRYILHTDTDGSRKVVPPITDHITYRIIAKNAFESAALFIGDDVFLPGFNEYREFILTGEPDLEGKSIIRCCRDYPWEPRHLIEFLPSQRQQEFAVEVRLFNAYIFAVFFIHPVRFPKIRAFQIEMDLDKGKTSFWALPVDGDKWKFMGGY
jgi:hypothetical protein